MDEQTAQSLTVEWIDVDPIDAMRLGVDGNDIEAQSRRLARADELATRLSQLTDQAYINAIGGNEPDVPAPFGLAVVRKHRGDLMAALADDELTADMTDYLGFGGQFVSDEDGPRWKSGLNQSAISAIADGMATLRAGERVEPIRDGRADGQGPYIRPNPLPEVAAEMVKQAAAQQRAASYSGFLDQPTIPAAGPDDPTEQKNLVDQLNVDFPRPATDAIRHQPPNTPDRPTLYRSSNNPDRGIQR